MTDIEKVDGEVVELPSEENPTEAENNATEDAATETVAQEIEEKVEETPEETPAEDAAPAEEEVPAAEETSAAEEAPATEEAAPVADEDAPAPEETPATEETPAESAAPAEEEAPAAEETSVAEEAPATEEAAPVADEEIPAAEDSPSTEEAAPVAEETEAADEKLTVVYETKEAVIARLRELAEGDEEVSRQERDYLKASFYKIHKQNTEAEYAKFVEEGGNPGDFKPTVDNDESVLKELLAARNAKRAKNAEAEKEEREANYTKKLAIIDKIKGILEKPEDVNRVYNDFKALQQEWNEIKLVPQDKATDLWKTYQHYVEIYYDTLKVTNELRAYDFKKNLELKTALCERAEALADMEDVIAAAKQLQGLHQEFREIGPVEKDLREALWNRFKAASTVVNKRHQEFFESRKEQEGENLARKTAICEQIEAINIDELKTFAQWNQKTDEIIALQQEWKTIGFAPQKMNVKIFERFRAACDNFFNHKSEFIKSVHESLNANYQLKLELCEQAEALKDSTDWKKTTDAIISLQKKWKEIGTVPKKYSDEIWKRFNAACDAFFAAKKEANSAVFGEQEENLKKKQAIIDQLAAIDPETEEGDFRPKLREAQDEWNQIGFVPFKQKETIYKAFRAQMDRLYGALNETASRRRINRFKSEVKDTDGRVKDKLIRQRDILTNEIKTYENNLGFLSISSKSKNGNALVEEINRKIEKLKAELKEVQEKIKALNEKQD